MASSSSSDISKTRAMLLFVCKVTCLLWCGFFHYSYYSLLFSAEVAAVSVRYNSRQDDVILESVAAGSDANEFAVWKNSLELTGRRSRWSEDDNDDAGSSGGGGGYDNGNSFRLSWKISDDDSDKLILLAQVRAKGYFGVGFSRDGIVDMAVGWINNKGKPFLFDCHEDTENEILVKDTVQNYELLGGYENSTHTVILFSRRLDTCDREHDVSLTNDTIQLVWIIGAEDPPDETLYGLRWHNSKEDRGSTYTYLQNSPIRSVVTHGSLSSSLPPTQQWDVTVSNLSIESRASRSVCRIFRTQKLQTKQHIIGYVPIVGGRRSNRNSIKRIALYECNGRHTFRIEQYMMENGFTCRHATSGAPEELESCLTPVFVWASGSDGEFLPEHVGIPMGPDVSYYMLEVYYESTNHKPTVADKAGLRLYYSDKLRKHDGGVFVTGTVISPLQIIPPFQTAYRTAGYCDKYCTNAVFPAGGVNTISVVLHSHSAARKVKLRHFRQGEELHPIVQDDRYEFKYQQSHSLDREITLFPGDELVTECTYNTVNRLKPIQGGYSDEHEEMCISYVTYYPRVSLAGCQSISPASNFFHTFGIKQFYSHDMDTVESALLGHRDKLFGKKHKFSSNAPPTYSSGDDIDEKLNDAIAEDRTMSKKSLPAPSDNGDADTTGYKNPLEDLVILEPTEFRDKTLKQHLQDLPWKEALLTQRVEEVFYYGKHMTFCRLQNGSLALPASTHIFPNVMIYLRVPTNENNCKLSSSDFRNTKQSPNTASRTTLLHWMHSFFLFVGSCLLYFLSSVYDYC